MAIKSEIDYDQFKDDLSFSGEPEKEPKKKKDKSSEKKSRRSIGRFFSALAPNRIGTTLSDIARNKNLMQKIGVTLFIVILYRLLASVPLPGIDMGVYEEFFGRVSASEASYLLLIFTGGQLDSPSIVGLGIAAYINASIIMQLLTPVIPKLTELQKEGARGTQLINQYTRYLTLPLAAMYSVAYVLLLSRRDLNSADGVTESANPAFLVESAPGADWPTLTKILFMALILTAGTMLLMWLAEIITENGIGNGSSIIITIGILSALPTLIGQDFSSIDFGGIISDVVGGSLRALTNPTLVSLFGLILGFIILVAIIVFVNESQRKIKIQSTRTAGASNAATSFLPIKITLTGVLPIIFASALLSVPQLIIPFVRNVFGDEVGEIFDRIESSFLYSTADSVVNGDDIIYAVVFFLMVVAFGVFYAFIAMKPKDVAENLQKRGDFVPGIRPGAATEKYISYVLLRIGFAGAVFLGIVAIIPTIARNLIQEYSGINLVILSGIGGTSILIAVSVILDILRQFNALRVTRSYERYT